MTRGPRSAKIPGQWGAGAGWHSRALADPATQLPGPASFPEVILQGIFYHLSRQHLLIMSYWNHFAVTYPENPYFATMMWVAKCAEWQETYGMFN